MEKQEIRFCSRIVFAEADFKGLRQNSKYMIKLKYVCDVFVAGTAGVKTKKVLHLTFWHGGDGNMPAPMSEYPSSPSPWSHMMWMSCLFEAAFWTTITAPVVSGTFTVAKISTAYLLSKTQRNAIIGFMGVAQVFPALYGHCLFIREPMYTGEVTCPKCLIGRQFLINIGKRDIKNHITVL